MGGGLWELERGAAALGGAASARRRHAGVDRDRNRGIAEEGRGEKNGMEIGEGEWGLGGEIERPRSPWSRRLERARRRTT